MLLINTIGIIIILLNLAGLVYLCFIGFKNITSKFNKDKKKIRIQPLDQSSQAADLKVITQEIVKEKDDMLDDLDLSDFDDLNLDDFD